MAMAQKVKIEEIISNPTAERSVISILLKDIDSITECSANNLYYEDFAIKANQTLYSVICYLIEEGTKRFDSNIIYSTIQDKDVLEELDSFGGRDYIDSLIQSRTLVENLGHYIRQIKDCSAKRKMYYLGKEIQENVEEIKDTTEMLNEIQKKVLNTMLESDSTSEIHKFGSGTYDRLMERAENPSEVFGYQIGWKEFDKITQGFAPNDLVVMVGASKTGKSTWLTNISKALSIDSDLCGLYIDTEMTEQEQEDRLIAMISRVPYEEIRNGMFGRDTVFGEASEKIARVKEASEKLANARLFHKYMPDFSIPKVTALMRKVKIQENIDYAIFDYIKLPNDDVKGLSTSQEYQRLGYFTTCLKDMAGVLGIPVITACQTNRNDLDTTNPDASNIGGSYRILQLATKLMFIRNKTDNELLTEGYSRGNQKIHIKYQRNGQGDMAVDVQFDRPILSQREVS